MAQQITDRRIVLALIASVLMFAGWVLAIVPAFHDLAGVVVVLILGLLLFALVLIPAGMDALYPERPSMRGAKRGLFAAVLAVLPAVALIVLTAVVMPIAPIFAVLAIAAEVLGIALYLWDWYTGLRSGTAARA
ncbi:MAG TPA: hypothetical protein VF116_21790 [Ktedonobacterales bacterium]